MTSSSHEPMIFLNSADPVIKNMVVEVQNSASLVLHSAASASSCIISHVLLVEHGEYHQDRFHQQTHVLCTQHHHNSHFCNPNTSLRGLAEMMRLQLWWSLRRRHLLIVGFFFANVEAPRQEALVVVVHVVHKLSMRAKNITPREGQQQQPQQWPGLLVFLGHC